NAERCLRLSPYGTLLACSTFENAVVLRDARTQKVVRAFGKRPPGAPDVMAFSPDGRTIATPGGQGKEDGQEIQPDIVLWETASGGERFRLTMNEGQVSQIAFSPNGRLLAAVGSGSTDTIHLWDTWTGTEAGRLTGHRGWPASIAFAPDGKTLASGG